MLKLLLLLSTIAYTAPNRSHLHLYATLTISLGSYSILHSASPTERITHSLLATNTIGVYKEYVDYRAGGRFDMDDIQYNILGSVLGVTIGYNFFNFFSQE